MRAATLGVTLIALSLPLVGGCPTVDPGDYPVLPAGCRPDMGEFRAAGGIWDTAIAPSDAAKSCVANGGCHDVLKGARSGFQVLARPRAELTDSEWNTNYAAVTRFLNCSSPEDSALIRKPRAGIENHLGGDLWACSAEGCEPIQTVETWIETAP